MNTSRITVRQVTPVAAASAVRRLLKRNLPEAVTEGRFDWAYLENPEGEALVWLAETAGGETVGSSAAFPRKFEVSGNIVRALVLSDFAIDSRFRTLGPALALLRATLGPVDDGTFEFALDHPSESMLAVYKRLGGTELSRLTRYVRLLKASAAARRRWGPGFSSAVVGALGDATIGISDRLRRVPSSLIVGEFEGAFNDEFAQVGRLLEERRVVCGRRSPDYLNWRYRSGIRFCYLTVTVRIEQELIAYAILQHRPEQSMKIVEFVSPADSAVERALFRGLIDVSRRYDVESLQASCMVGGAWSEILQRLGFSAREKSTGPVVYSPKNAKWTDILTDKDQWWMTDGDRDG